MNSDWLLLLLAMGCMLSSCTAVLDGSSLASNRSFNKFQIEKFQNLVLASAPKDESGKYYTHERVLKFSGFCKRGISGVQVLQEESKTVSASAACQNDGSFVLNVPVETDAIMKLSFSAINLRAGFESIDSESSSLEVVVDTVAPVSPNFTSLNGLSSVVSAIPNVVLDGSNSSDTDRFEIEGNAVAEFNKGALIFSILAMLN